MSNRARPLTPTLSPDGGEGEEADALIGGSAWLKNFVRRPWPIIKTDYAVKLDCEPGDFMLVA